MLLPLLAPAGSLMMMGGGVTAAPAATEHLDIDQDPATGCSNQAIVSGGANVAGSFKPTHSGKITGLSLKGTYVPSTVTWTVRWGTSNDLTTYSDSGSVEVSATGFSRVTFSPGVDVTAGTTYYYGWTGSDSTSYSQYCTGAAYADGNFYHDVDGWVLANDSGVYGKFRVYITY